MTSREFLDSVLAVRPRVAVFDCDGTLWAPDAGERFLRWEIREGLVADPVAHWVERRYAEYLDGKVDEDTMCGEMVTIHAGLPVSTVAQAAARFFSEQVEPKIFASMRELVRRLLEQGTDVWAVSSSNEWIIQEGMLRFGIRSARVLAAAVEIEDGCATDRLVRVPSGPGKREAIEEHVGAQVDAAFGNSIWDREMLMMGRHAFAINPNRNLEQVARERGWTVFWPEVEARTADAAEAAEENR
jgi:phosphoserine phosphatase